MKSHRYCPMCKHSLVRKKYEAKCRFVCQHCGWVYYSNPLPSVAAFVTNAKNEILLIKRGVKPGKNKWALPSGFIEHDELPEQAVLRELKEEAHITGMNQELLGVFVEPTKEYGNVVLIAYKVQGKDAKPKPGSDTVDARFIPIHRLPHIPFASHRNIIRRALAVNPHTPSLLELLKSKITEATVTETQLFYNGSMGIDGAIMRAANLLPGEKVHVLNYNNGERLETYTIEEKPHSGKMILYGPASLKGNVGDKLCILSYMLVPVSQAKQVRPSIVTLDRRNRIKRKKG